MKPKTIHYLYTEEPNGTPEEFPEKHKWLDRHLRSLERAKENPNIQKEIIDKEKTPPNELH